MSPIHGLVVVVVALVAALVHRVVLRRFVNTAWVWRAAWSVAGALLLVQAVPYGRAHTNPPVIEEPVWDSARTLELATAACYDCHSNETEWPWYTGWAPASWITQRHVDEGRDKLNFSEWNRSQEADEAAETVRDGSMPPVDYVLIHPEARLTGDQKQALIAGLEASLGEVEKDEADD